MIMTLHARPLARVALAVLSSLAWVCADAQTARLVPAQSDISFVTRQMGVPVEGRFRKFDAAIVLDPRKPQTGRVALSIALASAQIGDAETTRELGRPAWLDSARHSRRRFNFRQHLFHPRQLREP